MRKGPGDDTTVAVVARWVLRLAQAFVRWLLSDWTPPAWLVGIPAARPWLPAAVTPGRPAPAPERALPMPPAVLPSTSTAPDSPEAGPEAIATAPEPVAQAAVSTTRRPRDGNRTDHHVAVGCVDAFPWPLPEIQSRAVMIPTRRAVLSPSGSGGHPSSWRSGHGGDGDLSSVAEAVDTLRAAPPPTAWAVSVVLVADDPGSIRDTVLSVAEQTYSSWELLVVATGDGPPPALPVSDPRVRLVPAPGASPAAGRDRGVQAATGVLIAHLRPGERMAPLWLAAVAAALGDAPAAGVVVVGERLAMLGNDPLPIDLVDAGRSGRVVRVPSRRDLSCIAHRREAYLPGGGECFPGMTQRQLCAPAVIETLLDLRATAPESLPMALAAGSR